ncbi:MAG: TolC family protein [bacterium]|nr:TolC family protein [bacterium]
MNVWFPATAVRRAAVFLTASLALLAAGCASGPPRVGGVDGVSPAPDRPWIPPASTAVAVSPSGTAIPPEEAAARLANLTLAEVVDIALANSPATREAWANAKAAAAGYGAARGTRLPTLDGNASLSRGNAASAQNRSGTWSTTYGPGVTLSWQLLDFGGRAGRVEAARQGLLAADWTHNAVIQDAVLDVVTAFHNYGGAKAILEANRVSYAEADSSLAAAEARHEVGLATIADVLQARTARAQVKLDLQAVEGQVRTTRGALAVSMGYPANVPYDIEVGVPEVPLDGVVQAVDGLIAGAVAARPDLRAAQAQAQAAAARVRSARSDLLPTLSVSGSTGRLWTDGADDPVDRTSGALTLSIPLFGGFSGRHELARARAEADAAAERARGYEQRVVYEIFVAHSDFLTATERVRTAEELLASAEASEQVALGRYREGVGDILDLLSAQRALATARAQRINARLGWFTSLAQLARDAGVLGLHGANPLAPDNLHPEVAR